MKKKISILQMTVSMIVGIVLANVVYFGSTLLGIKTELATTNVSIGLVLVMFSVWYMLDLQRGLDLIEALGLGALICFGGLVGLFTIMPEFTVFIENKIAFPISIGIIISAQFFIIRSAKKDRLNIWKLYMFIFVFLTFIGSGSLLIVNGEVLYAILVFGTLILGLLQTIRHDYLSNHKGTQNWFSKKDKPTLV